MKNWLLLFLTFIFIFPSIGYGKEKKVAVFPIEVHAPERFSYLKDALQDMISVRLSVPEKVRVLDNSQTKNILKNLSPPLTQKKVLELGKKLQVDFVLWGSVSIIEKETSLDLKLTSIEKGTTFPLYAHTQLLEDLISKVSSLTSQALKYILNENISPRSKENIQIGKRNPERIFRLKLSPSSTEERNIDKSSSSLSSSPNFWFQEDYDFDEDDDYIGEVLKVKENNASKSFWNKIWPFKRKEREIVIPQTHTPPPPPPPPPPKSSWEEDFD